MCSKVHISNGSKQQLREFTEEKDKINVSFCLESYSISKTCNGYFIIIALSWCSGVKTCKGIQKDANIWFHNSFPRNHSSLETKKKEQADHWKHRVHLYTSQINTGGRNEILDSIQTHASCICMGVWAWQQSIAPTILNEVLYNNNNYIQSHPAPKILAGSVVQRKWSKKRESSPARPVEGPPIIY